MRVAVSVVALSAPDSVDCLASRVALSTIATVHLAPGSSAAAAVAVLHPLLEVVAESIEYNRCHSTCSREKPHRLDQNVHRSSRVSPSSWC